MSDRAAQDAFSQLVTAIQTEADAFGVIAKSAGFKKQISGFNNYPAYLRKRWRKVNTRQLLQRVTQGSRCIEAARRDPLLTEVFYGAHLAACCPIFSGWEIPEPDLTYAGMRRLTARLLEPYRHASEEARLSLTNRIHCSDAVRTAQILRLLGLYRTDSRECRQLSLAAGSGSRDIDGFHLTPRIYRVPADPKSGTPPRLSFGGEVIRPMRAYLVDNDPIYADHYRELPARHGNWLTGMNEDLDTALTRLQQWVRNGEAPLLNLILGIRIDHLMIPEPADFLSRVATIMEPEADLALSIGAGHTIEEFAGRTELMARIFDCLNDAGLSPVRIRLCHGEDTATQRMQPCFGISSLTTYDLLYCRLKRSNLTERL